MLGSRSAAISGVPEEKTVSGRGASPTRVLFHWRSVPIYAYPAMLSLGIAVGSIVTNYFAHLAGANAVRVYVATVLLLGPALIGARVLHVMAHRDLYRGEPARMWRRSDGGASLYGGLLVALVFSPPVLWLLDVPFWTFWDLATFTLLSGMVFAKTGCHLNGCCAGRPIAGFPGLVLSDHHGVRERRMPSQLLEAGWALLLLLALAMLRTGAPPPGPSSSRPLPATASGASCSSPRARGSTSSADGVSTARSRSPSCSWHSAPSSRDGSARPAHDRAVSTTPSE